MCSLESGTTSAFLAQGSGAQATSHIYLYELPLKSNSIHANFVSF
jgi:hypothetical protein